MDFSWSEEQLALKRSIDEFARGTLNDGVMADDRSSTFPRGKWAQCAAFGVLGLAVPEEYGGSGLDILTTMLAMETLGYRCRDNGLLFALNAQMWAVQTPILRFGSAEQRERYLLPLVRGASIGSHAITEPGSGSDSFTMSATAEQRGDRYILNGTKTFASNAPVADVFLVFAATSRARGFMGITAFLVEKGTPGLTVGRPIEKMGLRTSPYSEVILQDCEIPVDARLGNVGNGGTIFKHSMGWERACILASHVGAMQRQIETCVEYAKTRRQFGQAIGKFQQVSSMIVDMRLRLETSRLLLYRAGWLRAQGQEAIDEVALAKLHISECFVQSSLQAIQLHGGYGYSTEFEVERDLRDSLGGRIYSGTSEIQRDIIARQMGL
jgi:alkylation response protein AidB-like acyl-CoA dehydrogenase